MQGFLTESFFCLAGGDPSASTAEAKEQVDARSVYVGNVRIYNLLLSPSLYFASMRPMVLVYVMPLLNFYI